MADWLKANPTFSMEDYLWKISLPFAKIMMADATRIAYLSEDAAKKFRNRSRGGGEKVYDDADAFAAALGI